jgi:DNA-binding CsgD family transcriptional regulator
MSLPVLDQEGYELRLDGRPDDQHAPLIVHPKGTWLRKQCPWELRKVSALAHDKSTEYIKVIERVSTADAQYALLMHYHKLAGTIVVPARRAPMTLEEEVEAYNLFQSGASIQEVAAKLDKNISTIWRLAPGEPTRKYHHLHRYQKQEIDRLHEMKTPFKEIARVLDLPPRTVRYYLYEKEKK